MSREDAPTEYIVSMYKRCDYMLNYAGTKKCRKSKDHHGLLNRCDGKLKIRPDWCPLRPVIEAYEDLYREIRE